MAQASGNSAGKTGLSKWGVHLAVLFFVTLWTIPTLGILVTSLRDKNQIVASGWWNSSSPPRRRPTAGGRQGRAGGRQIYHQGQSVRGRPGQPDHCLRHQMRSTEFAVGTVADLGDGESLQINADGSYVHTSAKPFEGTRGQRVIMRRNATKIHHRELSQCADVGRRRTILPEPLTVTIPATIIPIMIAAFAAYALAWMRFPDALLIATIIGLLVVPLQMALIPLLEIYNGVGNLFGVPSRPISASGWRIPASACPSPSICCAAIWPACRAN
jgi:alpha-glucoside transport system permease protein